MHPQVYGRQPGFSRYRRGGADTEAMRSSSDRWFGAGHSTAPDSGKAGAEATAAALGGRTAEAVLVFCSSTHDLPTLLRAVRAEAGPGVVVAGGTTLGEISPAGATEHGVAVAALGGAGFAVRTRVASVDELGPRAAGADVAQVVAEVDRPYTVLMLLSAGLRPGPLEIVRGAYSVVGATVPLVGGVRSRSAAARPGWAARRSRWSAGSPRTTGWGRTAPNCTTATC